MVSNLTETNPNTPGSKSGASHWMSRMLSPASIAIVGASEKPGSFGQAVRQLLDDHQYSGRIYLVNPRYHEIQGQRCYENLLTLPASPDLVVMVIGNRAMETSVDQAIAMGAGGVVIFANNYLEQDQTPLLLDRLKTLANNAKLPICGGNGMGFYNYDANTLVSFDRPPERPSGHIALIAHSGSVMTYLANTDPRLTYNLVVSPGQEISGSVADYMHYALEQPSTRVIAVFIETVRDPNGFVSVLKQARLKRIPVVVVKVGATEKSARMAVSHSGAVAGSDSAFQAVCDLYGAIRVADMDELAATAMVLAMAKKIGDGGLSSLLDSGGLREQMIDLSAACDVVFTDLGDQAKTSLAGILEHGLSAENPVDAMGSLNADVKSVYQNCLAALDGDPGSALISLEFEFRDGFSHYPELLEVAKEAATTLDKPFLMINSSVNTANSEDAVALSKLGVPVINGVARALTAIGKAFWYRDHLQFTEVIPNLDSQLVTKWQRKLDEEFIFDEALSLALLAECGLPTVDHQLVENPLALQAAADQLGFPLVLKSAKRGLLHKSDVGGVVINIENIEALSAAYTDISLRLGERALLSSMVNGGIELGFGMVNDPQFGPIVMVCAGGIFIELLEDRKFLPAPFGVEQATEMLQSLAIAKLLNGARGRGPCRIDLAANALSRFSEIAYVFRDNIKEIDLNPVIVTEQQCVIVDALIV